MDLCVHLEPSLGGSKYMLVIVNNRGRRVTAYFTKSKGDTASVIQTMTEQAETQTGERVQRIRTDNGGKFTGHMLEEFLKRKGIVHERTMPCSPLQSDIPECTNRTPVETAWILLPDTKLSGHFWAETMNITAYVWSRCSKKVLNGVVPKKSTLEGSPLSTTSKYLHAKLHGIAEGLQGSQQ